jgi:hypothetical protein
MTCSRLGLFSLIDPIFPTRAESRGYVAGRKIRLAHLFRATSRADQDRTRARSAPFDAGALVADHAGEPMPQRAVSGRQQREPGNKRTSNYSGDSHRYVHWWGNLDTEV